VLVLQGAARLAGWAAFLAACGLAGVGSDFGRASLAFAALAVAGYLVRLIPARVGVQEGMAYLVFPLFGLDAGLGLVVMLLLRLKALASNGLGAVLALGSAGHTRPVARHRA
jgi:hypothetical protein